ncbi:putative ribonuclease H protein [Glycine soja]
MGDLWVAAHSHHSLLRQKARSRWLKEGDCNSRYFHLMMNASRRHNLLKGIMIEGAWVDEPRKVKEAVRVFFQQRFHEPEPSRPTLDGIRFQSINQQQNDMLVGRFQEEEASMENIKAIKTILRAFELVSGLKINFAKSSFGAIGMSDSWKQNTAIFLNCSLLAIPFVYLGIPIGANPRKYHMWDPIIQKVPRRVVKKLVCIQRSFLWGDGDDQHKIAWVKWETVCLPKDKGGLGIKDITKFNLALLAKWKWNLFHHNGELWARILESKWRCWWLALIWSVWQHRNKIIFSNVTFDGNKVMEDAIFTLWTWLKSFEKDFAIPYTYWASNISTGFVSSGG